MVMWALESEISKGRSEQFRLREPHCHSAPRPGNRYEYSRTNIRTNRTLLEITFNRLQFRRCLYASIFIRFL